MAIVETIMFKRILVPVDFTDKCREAISVAQGIARESQATLILLHVLDDLGGATIDGIDSVGEIQERCQAVAIENLRSLATEVGATDVTIDPQVILGERSKEKEIVEYARGNEIDLIVLASHKVQPEEPGRGIGTVSYKVGILAPCAIILVK